MNTLTIRQHAILQFIRTHLKQNQMPPTWGEIAAAFGIVSNRAVQKHLQAIEAKGFIHLHSGKSRGITLRSRTRTLAETSSDTGKPIAAINPASSQFKHRTTSQMQLRLPLLGRVAAGLPIGADAAGSADIDDSEYVVVAHDLFSGTPDYLLRVQGDSMIDDGILDGDWVAIQQRNQADSGALVVARIEDEITIKRLQITADAIRLLPRNPAHRPIVVKPDQEFAIEGVFCGLIRRG